LLHRAYANLGLDPEHMPIASLTTSESEVQQMGADIAQGHITAAPYFQSVPDEVNRSCVERYKQRFGEDEVTNQCWEAAYFQMHMLADAMRRMASDHVSDLLRVLPGSSYAAPQGTVRIDEHNHHTYLHPRIGRINASGQFDILEQVERAVRPDPYLVSHSLQDWSARSRLTGRS
jgi:branched-chain amino acid transport system substrate-binding protein